MIITPSLSLSHANTLRRSKIVGAFSFSTKAEKGLLRTDMAQPDAAYLFILNFFKRMNTRLFRYDPDTQTITMTISILHMLVKEAMKKDEQKHDT